MFYETLFVEILLIHLPWQVIEGTALFHQRIWPRPHSRLEFVTTPREPFDKLIQLHVFICHLIFDLIVQCAKRQKFGSKFVRIRIDLRRVSEVFGPA